MKVLVTGAEEHQGLAVIRGLGLAGVPVVACGTEARSAGFYSRFAGATGRYTSPFRDRQRFVDDVIDIARHTHATMIVPVVESTLVVLSEARAQVEQHALLATPPPEVLEYALDKEKTLRLAERLGIPAPASVRGDRIDAALAEARGLRFPVAVKPRGNGLHLSTANKVGFKVRYARSLEELQRILEAARRRDLPAMLIQEYMPGTGRCVSAVCRRGEPLALFAYAREREFPLSGGVSVLRRSIPLDDRLARWTVALLGEIGWHGVAMVEFKYDDRADRYALMEINGRFQASTALALDAGVNLAHLTACVFAGRPTPPTPPPLLGVRERWLRGDLMALRDGLTLGGRYAVTRAPVGLRPSRGRVVWEFLRDFRPGTRYDEFKLYDWKPGLVELRAIGSMLLGWVREWLATNARYVTRLLAPGRSMAAS